mmetsp:Transcript_88318/g.201978  ORF Transcript_88318/g.201978 Transcript_88318/m.201978 type:complete len:227 (+) Transcript_88318:1856-2536(+)
MSLRACRCADEPSVASLSLEVRLGGGGPYTVGKTKRCDAVDRRFRFCVQFRFFFFFDWTVALLASLPPGCRGHGGRARGAGRRALLGKGRRGEVGGCIRCPAPSLAGRAQAGGRAMLLLVPQCSGAGSPGRRARASNSPEESTNQTSSSSDRSQTRAHSPVGARRWVHNWAWQVLGRRRCSPRLRRGGAGPGQGPDGAGSRACVVQMSTETSPRTGPLRGPCSCGG